MDRRGESDDREDQGNAQAGDAELQLPNEDLDALVAYMSSLKKK